jgi:hypothetical protein
MQQALRLQRKLTEPDPLGDFAPRRIEMHLIDEAGQPTLAARDAILAFLARRLKSTSASH